MNTKIQHLNCFLPPFLQNSVEIALQQNEIMNTFIDDWKCLAEEEGTFGDKTDTHLKEYQSFTDLHNLTEKMIDLFTILIGAVVSQMYASVRAHTLYVFNGCGLLYINYPSINLMKVKYICKPKITSYVNE